MVNNIQITPKQYRTLCQVENFQKSRCYSATIGELAQALNISRATAYEHIAGLRERGLLIRSTGKARSLRLTNRGEKLLEQARNVPSDPFEVTSNSRQTDDALNPVFLRGRVCAGYGIDSIEEQTPFSLPDVFGNHSDLFVLEVCGQSMIDAGINNGDYV